MSQKEVWALRAAGFLIVTVMYFVWTGLSGSDEPQPTEAATSSVSSRAASSVGQGQSSH